MILWQDEAAPVAVRPAASRMRARGNELGVTMGDVYIHVQQCSCCSSGKFVTPFQNGF